MAGEEEEGVLGRSCSDEDVRTNPNPNRAIREMRFFAPLPPSASVLGLSVFGGEAIGGGEVSEEGGAGDNGVGRRGAVGSLGGDRGS